MFAFTDQILLEREDAVVTYRGIDEKGASFFAYILCDKAGMRRICSDYDGRHCNALSAYGKVIYLDELMEPDDSAKLFLRHFVEAYPSIKDLL